MIRWGPWTRFSITWLQSSLHNLAHHAHGGQGDAQLGRDCDLSHGCIPQTKEMPLRTKMHFDSSSYQDGMLITSCLEHEFNQRWGVFNPHHFKFSVGQWDCFVKQFNGLLQIASLHLQNQTCTRDYIELLTLCCLKSISSISTVTFYTLLTSIF